jgi:hypothetical protein
MNCGIWLGDYLALFSSCGSTSFFPALRHKYLRLNPSNNWILITSALHLSLLQHSLYILFPTPIVGTTTNLPSALLGRLQAPHSNHNRQDDQKPKTPSHSFDENQVSIIIWIQVVKQSPKISLFNHFDCTRGFVAAGQSNMASLMDWASPSPKLSIMPLRLKMNPLSRGSCTSMSMLSAM